MRPCALLRACLPAEPPVEAARWPPFGLSLGLRGRGQGRCWQAAREALRRRGCQRPRGSGRGTRGPRLRRRSWTRVPLP